MAYRDPESDDQTPVDTTPPATKSSAPLLPDTAGDPAALLGGSTTADSKLQERLIGLDKSKLDYERSFLGETFKEDRFYKGQADRAYSLEAHDLNDPALKGWNADAEKAKYSTDPIQAFGSFASIAGIIAAAFVHAPIATALDASASAMKAIHDGDDKMYDAAHQAWKDNTELFLKRHEMVHQAYTDALEARKTNWTIGNDKFKAAALMFGDQQVLALHEAGMFPEIEKLLQDRETTKLKIAEASVKNEKDHADLQVMRDFGFRFPNEPEYNPENNIKAMQQFQELKHPIKATEDAVAIEAKAQQIHEADPTIPMADARLQAIEEVSKAKGAAAEQRVDKTQAGLKERQDAALASREKLTEEQIESRENIAQFNAANRLETAKLRTQINRGGLSPEESKAADAKIVKAIKEGRQPPILTGLYGHSANVRAGLEDENFDLANAQQEWSRANKQISSLNSTQMIQFTGLANNIRSTIDRVNELAEQMDLSGVSAVNKLELETYISKFGNTKGGQLATAYVTEITGLEEEFANLARSGYAPTESAFELAHRQIGSNYGVKQLHASLEEVKRLINYRIMSIPNLSTFGPGAPNRYGTSPATPTGDWNIEEVH